VVLLHHQRSQSRKSAGSQQLSEYKRICAMDAGQFRLFINNHDAAEHKVLTPKPKPIVRPKLGHQAADFGPTQFNSAEDKLLFRNELIKFLCNHCDKDRFTRRLYDGLHQYMGHIAHYNLAGFYEEWFASVASRIKFMERHAIDTVYGSWRDVDQSFKQWLAGPEGQKVLAYYRGELADQTNMTERRLLKALKAKHETVIEKEA
jgi:hypothetical protein